MAKRSGYSSIIKEKPFEEQDVNRIRSTDKEAISSIPLTSPIRVITIENKEFRTESVIDNVSFLQITEVSVGLPTAEIRILNEDLKYTDDPIFREQNIVQIWTGFSERSIKKRGSFRIVSVSSNFSGGNDLEITLSCVGIIYDMMHTERRRTWENVKDSDIVFILAEEYGFEHFIQRTDVVHSSISQMNESDYNFLMKRARLHGFDLFVSELDSNTGKPVLHYHEPLATETLLTPLKFGGGSANGSLEFFEVTTESHMKYVEFNSTQMNPLTKKYISVSSSEEEEIPLQKTLKGFNKPSEDITKISTINGEKPVVFLMEEGHLRSLEEVKRQNQKFSEFTRYNVVGSGKMIGMEALSARQIIRIEDIGRFTGDYFVTKAIHTIEDSYDVEFEVIRLGYSDFEGKKRSPRNFFSSGKEYLTEKLNIFKSLKKERSVDSNTSVSQGPGNNSRING